MTWSSRPSESKVYCEEVLNSLMFVGGDTGIANTIATPALPG